MSKSKPVAITGMGMITSLGQGKDENWARLTAGASGIKTISRFPIEELRTTIAGCVDFLDLDRVTPPALSHRMAQLSAREAVAQAGLEDEAEFPGELFVAAPPIEHDWISRYKLAHAPAHRADSPYVRGEDGKTTNEDGCELHVDFINGTLADRLAAEFRTQGSPITLTTACASGATAIQLGVEAIRRGSCKAALAVGTDGSIQEEALIRFSLLSALSTQNDAPEKASKPFAKNRDGFVMAEGAATLVLEDLEHAKARGAKILATIVGCGEAADTFHRTRSNPNGASIIRCMQEALDDAGVSASDVGYINAHGTGTPENDKMENLGITEVFGKHAEKLAVSSNKSMIGHTLTAAGAVEAVITAMTLNTGILPPTINHDEPDDTITLDVVPNEKRVAKAEYALSNSFGFGGQNVSLLIRAGEA